MSGQEASSGHRRGLFDTGLEAELDSWPDAPEPSWLTDDDGDESSTSHTPAYDLGPGTESVVVDLTGPMPTLSVPDELDEAPADEVVAAVPVEPPADVPVSPSPVVEPLIPAFEAPPLDVPQDALPEALPPGPGPEAVAEAVAATEVPPAPPLPVVRDQVEPPSFDDPAGAAGDRPQPGRDPDGGHRAALPQGAAADRLAQDGAARHRRPDQLRPLARGPPARRPGEPRADARRGLPPGRDHQSQGRRRQDDDDGRTGRDVREPARRPRDRRRRQPRPRHAHRAGTARVRRDGAPPARVTRPRHAVRRRARVHLAVARPGWRCWPPTPTPAPRPP